MIEIPFERQNVEYRARPYVRDIDRQRVTPVYAEYAKWRAITGSGDKVGICPNIVVVSNPKQTCA